MLKKRHLVVFQPSVPDPSHPPPGPDSNAEHGDKTPRLPVMFYEPQTLDVLSICGIEQHRMSADHLTELYEWARENEFPTQSLTSLPPFACRVHLDSGAQMVIPHVMNGQIIGEMVKGDALATENMVRDQQEQLQRIAKAQAAQQAAQSIARPMMIPGNLRRR